MTILFDNIIFSLQKVGGISVYWGELLKRAPDHCFCLSHPSAQFNLVQKELDLRKFKKIDDQFPPAFSRYLPLGRLPPHLDVIHSSYYRTPWRLMRSNIPTIVTLYDFTYEYFRSGPARAIHSAQKKAALKRADRILCISENTKKDLAQLYGDALANKAVVTPLAAGAGIGFTAGAREKLEAGGFPFLKRARPYLLFVGARRFYKGFDLALKALALLPEYDLVAVGGEPWTPHIDLRDVSESAASHVYHVGSVAPSQLSQWYSAAHACLYLSSYEGFGIPVLEANLCRCPVIARNRSSIPEVHGDARLLVVDGDESEQVSQMVKRLESTQSRDEMICTCENWASRFTWDVTWNLTRKVYEQFGEL